MPTLRHHRYCVLWLFVGTALVGCGDSKRDVISRYQAQGNQWRQTLAEISKALPPAGSVKNLRAAPQLTPLPTVDVAKGTGNVEFVMASQLADPDSEPEFDLMLSNDLLRCLRWTGPKNPMVDSALDSAAGAIEQDFQRAFACAYLVVIRVVRFEPPKTVGDSQFAGGEATLEVFLFRASDRSLLGSFPVQATASDSVQVEWRKNEERDERARAAVHSSVWVEARQKIAQGLREVSGGEFAFER